VLRCIHAAVMIVRRFDRFAAVRVGGCSTWNWTQLSVEGICHGNTLGVTRDEKVRAFIQDSRHAMITHATSTAHNHHITTAHVKCNCLSSKCTEKAVRHTNYTRQVKPHPHNTTTTNKTNETRRGQACVYQDTPLQRLTVPGGSCRLVPPKRNTPVHPRLIPTTGFVKSCSASSTWHCADQFSKHDNSGLTTSNLTPPPLPPRPRKQTNERKNERTNKHTTLAMVQTKRSEDHRPAPLGKHTPMWACRLE
jgi:hypothetical protein